MSAFRLPFDPIILKHVLQIENGDKQIVYELLLWSVLAQVGNLCKMSAKIGSSVLITRVIDYTVCIYNLELLNNTLKMAVFWAVAP